MKIRTLKELLIDIEDDIIIYGEEFMVNCCFKNNTLFDYDGSKKWNTDKESLGRLRDHILYKSE